MPVKKDVKATETEEEIGAKIAAMVTSAGEVIGRYGALSQNIGVTDHNQAINLARQLFGLPSNYTADDLKKSYRTRRREFFVDHYHGRLNEDQTKIISSCLQIIIIANELLQQQLSVSPGAEQEGPQQRRVYIFDGFDFAQVIPPHNDNFYHWYYPSSEAFNPAVADATTREWFLKAFALIKFVMDAYSGYLAQGDLDSPNHPKAVAKKNGLLKATQLFKDICVQISDKPPGKYQLKYGTKGLSSEEIEAINYAVRLLQMIGGGQKSIKITQANIGSINLEIPAIDTTVSLVQRLRQSFAGNPDPKAKPRVQSEPTERTHDGHHFPKAGSDSLFFAPDHTKNVYYPTSASEYKCRDNSVLAWFDQVANLLAFVQKAYQDNAPQLSLMLEVIKAYAFFFSGKLSEAERQLDRTGSKYAFKLLSGPWGQEYALYVLALIKRIDGGIQVETSGSYPNLMVTLEKKTLKW